MATARIEKFNARAVVNHTRNDVRLSISTLAKSDKVKAASIQDLDKWLEKTITEKDGMSAFGKEWKPRPGETRAGVLDKKALIKTLKTLEKSLDKLSEKGFGKTATGKDKTPTSAAEMQKLFDNELVKALKGNLMVEAAKGGKTRPATAAEIRQWVQ